MLKGINKHQLFTVFGLYFLGLEIFGLVLAMVGMFYAWLIMTYITLSAVLFIFILFHNRQSAKECLKSWPIAVISVLFIFLFAHFTIPTIFSGRDQGSLSEAAIRLTQNHKLAFSTPASQEFFKIYGPGTALNFPGFDYTKSGRLITNFPLGYSTWLAIFYSLFDVNGFIIANGVTLFVFLVSLFLVARMFLDRYGAVWTWILAITSFSFMWFFKFTLSENLAMALFWFGMLEFLWFWKKENNFYLLASLLSLSIMAFTRIEALAVLVMVFLAIWIKYKNWTLVKEKLWKKEIILPLLFIAVLFIFDLIVNLPFYRVFAKGFLSAFFPAKNEVDIPSYSPAFNLYLVNVLWIYTILNFLVLAFLGLIIFLKRKNYWVLLPAFISLPVAIYLFNPSISSDHPWMLRRFVFVILPIAILYTVLFLEKFFTHKLVARIMLALLLFMNLAVFIPYVSRADNENLLSQTEKMSQNFGPDDLILMDREASGNGFSMLTGPMSFLYGKQAVYFFNSSDLDKIDKKRFNNIYLVIPDKNFDFWEESGILNSFSLVDSYTIKTSSLDIMTGKKSDIYQQPVEFPQEVKTVVNGKIYKLK